MVWDQLERLLAVRTLYGEARGEGQVGMIAVGHVLLNRLKSGRWGPSLSLVCLAPYQFSCWNSGDPNRYVLLTIKTTDPALIPSSSAFDIASTDVTDPTLGATHYKAIGSAASWAAMRQPCVVIGRHEFYNNIP